MEVLKIEEIQGGEWDEKTANAITWVLHYSRGEKTAYLECGLIEVLKDGGSKQVSTFSLELPEEIMMKFVGNDMSLIDDYVVLYSPKFIKSKE